jgi:hypothetical protein
VQGIVKLTQKLHVCTVKRGLWRVLGFHEPLYFRYSHPLSFPQGEGVWERFFINLTYMDPPALSRSLERHNTLRNRCSHISVYGLLPSCKLKMDDARWRAACVYATSRGERPRVLMFYAPLVLIGLTAFSCLGYRQVGQGTVQPTAHQPCCELVWERMSLLTCGASSCIFTTGVPSQC